MCGIPRCGLTMKSVPKTSVKFPNLWAFIRNLAAAIFAMFAFESHVYADINKLSTELKTKFGYSGQSLSKPSKSYLELAKNSSDSLLEDDDDEDDEDSLLKDEEEEETNQKVSDDAKVVKDADAEHQALFSEKRFPAAWKFAEFPPKSLAAICILYNRSSLPIPIFLCKTK